MHVCSGRWWCILACMRMLLLFRHCCVALRLFVCACAADISEAPAGLPEPTCVLRNQTLLLQACTMRHRHACSWQQVSLYASCSSFATVCMSFLAIHVHASGSCVSGAYVCMNVLAAVTLCCTCSAASRGTTHAQAQSWARVVRCESSQASPSSSALFNNQRSQKGSKRICGYRCMLVVHKRSESFTFIVPNV